MLTLTLPTVTHASDYDLEQRVFELEQRALDLEWQAHAAQQRAIDAEMEAASAKRNAELNAIFAPRPTPSFELLDFGPGYLPPPEEPSRSMRPPWLQPVDSMIPMLPEYRARMFCAAPTDCWLNQTGREGF
jgi:hypothetical protein